MQTQELLMQGLSLDYVEDLYSRYLNDPAEVDLSWRNIFANLNFNHSTSNVDQAQTSNITETQLDLIRKNGHLWANTNPLQAPTPMPEDLAQHFAQEFYCQTLSCEINSPNLAEQKWWQEQLEQKFNFTPSEQKQILAELVSAEGLEKHLGAKFPGAKRFSLEGSDSFIPMLRGIIRSASSLGVQDVVMGMAHRGRLNALVNVLGKTSQELFAEFAGKHDHYASGNGSGDVKYHQGMRGDFETEHGKVHLNLAYNPSHLEIVNPVVAGITRAKQDRKASSCAQQVLGITVHGDSAVIGQGIVQETLNLSQLRGYSTQGTIRIVINNQIGFTTSNPKDTRSSLYCTDIAKMLNAPVLHVNGDDPESCVRAGKLAVAYRQAFKRDVFIDLISYRRHGHNEADEPALTQPLMYQQIKQHLTTASLYAEKLHQQGVIDKQYLKNLYHQYRSSLEGESQASSNQAQSDYWQEYLIQHWDSFTNNLTFEQCQALAQKLSTLPTDIQLHSRVQRLYSQRQAMACGEQKLDWGMAENLAYASLLQAGVHIRLTGEDVERGTFSHRHAVLHGADGKEFSILQQFTQPELAKQLQIYNSPLSEEGVLAFEYGYASTNPYCLTIWEAQFGDFANVAQVVMDQFISSGEQKWGRMCGLTMLLPHGYEGQGPEHSSARLERYLQLCGEDNMQVCVPSTPAQIFHLLRQQALRKVRRPLVVMTPKSLLRHPQAVSSLEDLASEGFQTVIADQKVNPQNVKKVIFCTGKVYYDLVAKRTAKAMDNIAIVRLEQLYPYPAQEVRQILAKYENAKEFVWCQEEPQNQGAWWYIQQHLVYQLPVNEPLQYVGRKAMASTATGYTAQHQQEQEQLIELAMD